jgi:Calx-beta domain
MQSGGSRFSAAQRSGIGPALFALFAICSAGLVQAQVNDPPVITLPSPLPVTAPQTPTLLGATLADPDAGGGLMTLSFSFSDTGGAFTPTQVGRVDWDFGTNVVSDSANATLAQLQAALADLTFKPQPGYAGAVAFLISVNDNGNTGTGGAKSDTLQFAIKVCTPAEANNATACANNNPPVNGVVSPAPDTQLQTTVAIPWSVSDVDVGAGNMEMEINLAAHSGPLLPAQVGTFSWNFGNNVTSDVALTTLAPLNAALAGLTFRPALGFAGQARLVFEIDDQFNSGVGDVDPLADTDFIIIDVCVPAELGTAACATNNNPQNILPGPTAWTTPSETPLAIPFSIEDVDAGTAPMQMELNLVDADGVLTPAQVGSFSWTFGNNVTADVATISRGSLNAALATLVFTPHPSFVGTARLVMEIDDRGNSGNSGVIASDTDFRDIPVTARPGFVELASPCTRRAGENTTVSLRIRRRDGDDGAASISVSTLNGTAVSGADFQMTSPSVLNWADQDRTDRFATFTIVNDGMVESAETFSVLLQSVTGATLGNPASVAVRIEPSLFNDVVQMQDGFELISCP